MLSLSLGPAASPVPGIGARAGLAAGAVALPAAQGAWLWHGTIFLIWS